MDEPSLGWAEQAASGGGAYDTALLGQGPDEQCPTVIEPYRCFLDRRHPGECESWGLDVAGDEVTVMLGVQPVYSRLP